MTKTPRQQPWKDLFFRHKPGQQKQNKNGNVSKGKWIHVEDDLKMFFSYSFYWAWQFPLTCEFTRGFFDGAPSFLKGVFVTSLTWKMVGGPRMCRLGDLLYIWMDNKKYGNFGYPQYPYPNLIWG